MTSMPKVSEGTLGNQEISDLHISGGMGKMNIGIVINTYPMKDNIELYLFFIRYNQVVADLRSYKCYWQSMLQLGCIPRRKRQEKANRTHKMMRGKLSEAVKEAVILGRNFRKKEEIADNPLEKSIYKELALICCGMVRDWKICVQSYREFTCCS